MIGQMSSFSNQYAKSRSGGVVFSVLNLHPFIFSKDVDRHEIFKRILGKEFKYNESSNIDPLLLSWMTTFMDREVFFYMFELTY